jgi:hypothetical protein
MKQHPVTVTPSPQHGTQYVTAWAAPSRTHAHVTYTVRYDRLENAWSCECAAYHYRGHCAHLQAAIDDFTATWPTAARKIRAA